MLGPAVGTYTSFFYPLGNTPAINVTRNIPRGVDADLLLLGCGDLRNILFTVYEEDGGPLRLLDFTCCDYDTGVIARNVFLLSLLVDTNTDALDTDSLWEIYCHLYVDDSVLTRTLDHVKKLLTASLSPEAWNSSSYAATIRFRDVKTLADVRDIWIKYRAVGDAAHHKQTLSALEKAVARSRSYRGQIAGAGAGITTTGIMSAAPALVSSADNIVREFDQYWKNGITSQQPLAAKRANPLFASTLTPHKILHYMTDPILGFHLATGFTPLAESSPLRPDLKDRDAFKSVQAARAQFRWWIIALKKRLTQENIVIRYIVAEALSLCHTFQAAQADGALTAYLYRCSFDPSPLVLEEAGPCAFDAVDTSNLCDHFGLLNILVAAAPLLKDKPWACLSSEALLKREQSHLSTFENLACADSGTLFILIGISPLEYWSNSTTTSTYSDFIGNSVNTTARTSPLRLVWTKHSSLAGEVAGPVYIDPKGVARALFEVYKNMFRSEKLGSLVQSMRKDAKQTLSNISYPHFHRGSFTALLKHIQKNVVTLWDDVYEGLIDMISQDRTIIIGNNLVQELEANLALHGLHRSEWLTRELRDKTCPVVSAVTLVVPRDKLKSLYVSEKSKIAGPVFQVMIQSSYGMWSNLFEALHLSFGNIKMSGAGEQRRAEVAQYGEAWGGNNDLVVSFYAPTAALLVELNTALISLRLRPTPTAILNHSGLGMELKVFQTTLGDGQRVFLTRYLPGQRGYPVLCGKNMQPLPKLTAPPELTGHVDAFSGRVVTLAGRVDMSASERKRLLTDKVLLHLRQPSPFVVEIVFESQPPETFKLRFPIPVDKTSAKTRIARASGYVEIVVTIANPLTSELLPYAMCPTIISDRPLCPPVALNMPHLHLDGLPILDLSDDKKDEKGERDIRWLNSLTSFQFTAEERKIRLSSTTAKDGLGASVRVNFKETIFTMFMLASGLQGGQSGVFAISTPHDKTTHMLISVRCIRLDGAAGSAILDAAVLPVDTELVRKNSDLQSFLVSVHTLVEVCQVNVDANELVLWKQVMPAMAERCRTWEHERDRCEYLKVGRAPTSIRPKEAFLCSCGRGKGLGDFVPVPDWDEAAKYSTRVAISPIFGVSIVEDTIGELGEMMKEVNLGGSNVPGEEVGQKCRKCGTRGAAELKKCSRCRLVSYCSVDCQKADWRTHKNECKLAQEKSV